MPGVQEIIALGIVVLVAGNFLWRRRARRAGRANTGDCGNCPSSGPPPKEAPLRFYRRRKDSDAPDGGSPDKPG